MNQPNYKKTEERIVIDIKELMWRLLEQWRLIIIFLIIFTLLFLAVTYIYDNKSEKNAGPAVVLTPEEQLAQLDSIGQERVLSAFRINKSIDETNAYIANAPLMKINPAEANSIVLLWQINYGEATDTRNGDFYSSDAVKYDIADSISSAINEKYTSESLAELIQIKCTDNNSSAADDGTAYLNVTVSFPYEIDPEQVKEAVISCMGTVYDKWNNGLGTHSISLLSVEFRTVSNDDIAAKQAKVYEDLNKLYAQRKTSIDNLSAEQKSVYSNLITGQSVTVNQIVHTPFFSIKRFVLSLLLGCVLYILVLLYRIIISSNVQSPAHAEDLFGIAALGECYPEKENSIINSIKCDYNIVKYRHKGYTDVEKNAYETSETISAISKHYNYKSILIASCADLEKGTKEYTEMLKKSLNNDGLEVSEVFMNYKKGIRIGEKTIMSADGIVVISDKKNTTLKDLKDICKKSDYCGVPLLGAVYIG